MSRPRIAGQTVIGLLIGLSLLPLLPPWQAACAQLPFLDEMPWYARPDSAAGRSLVIHYDRFEDGKTRWIANRFGMTGIMSSGTESIFFVRAYFLAFDRGKLPLLVRWPHLAGSVTQEWPGESRSVAWVRPEVGMIGSITLPGLGAGRFALAVALPVGRDELYPFTSASMPLQLQFRRSWRIGDHWRIGGGAGYLLHFDSGRDDLVADSFPSGASAVFGLARHRGGRQQAEFLLTTRSGDGRRAERLVASWWWPLRSGALGVRLHREIGPAAHRPFTTMITLGWRIVGVQEPAEDSSGR